MPPDADSLRLQVEAIYRAESRRVFATLVRLLGDFDTAEEALAEAFRAALEQWPREGLPANPRAWLVSAGRFRAIDGIRRQARFDSLDDHAERVESFADETVPAWEREEIEDDRLRLIFTCCHPALAIEARIALTLREVCGLTTEAIARAFLAPAPTLAQRIVRAKAKIRAAGIPYQVPGRDQLAERLDAVLRVVYLVFNEGYSASSGGALTRADLSAEAIRLGRLLVDLLPERERPLRSAKPSSAARRSPLERERPLRSAKPSSASEKKPDHPEAIGLLALMLLQESRRAARSDAAGDVVLLADQDRGLWDRALIAEGCALVEQALASREAGPYTLQAAIAAVHAGAPTAEATDWAQIVGLYDVLARLDPSPVVRLNRAVAVAMRDGPAAGLALVDGILASGELADYHLVHASRGELCRRLGRTEEARAAFSRALDLAGSEPERRLLRRRLGELIA